MSIAKTCRQCSADVEVKPLDKFEGEEQGARAAIEGMPAAVCLNGHRRFTTPDFPLRIVQTVMKAKALFAAPQAVKKGLFKKHFHCPDCGKELAAESSTHTDAKASLQLDSLDAFSVTVELPLHRCPGCGKEATMPRDDLEGPVMKAVANAFRAAEIPPG